MRAQSHYLLLGGALLFGSACSNAGKNESQTAAAPAPASTSEDAISTPQGARIILQPKGELIDIQGSVVGTASTLSTLPEIGSKPGFKNLLPGTYDVILEAKRPLADGTTLPVALRVSGVRVTAGDTYLRELELLPYIRLRGRVSLAHAASPANVVVTIPGTSYKAVSAEDGSYSFEALPQGQHAFEFQLNAYTKGSIQSLDYREAGELSAIELVLQSEREKLVSGAAYLGAPLTAGGTAVLPIQLLAPQGMTHFRYATNGASLADSSWHVLQSSFELAQPAGDAPALEVQFSRSERQLSPVYKVALPVE